MPNQPFRPVVHWRPQLRVTPLTRLKLLIKLELSCLMLRNNTMPFGL